MPICSKCKEQKKSDQFYKNRSLKNGLANWCKSCCSESAEEHKERNRNYKKGYYREHKDRLRNSELQARYGITQERWESILIAQEGVCACCFGPPSSRGWQVDHDHITGQVRGLLCQYCNVMLGNAFDATVRLQQGIDYLKRFSHVKTLSS